jgi:membrane protease YdiL (CAAX protease family)
MNFEVSFFFVVFVVLLFYLAVIAPVTGYIEHKKLKQSLVDGLNKKLSVYRQTILWSWIPVLIIVFLIPFSQLTINNLGFRWIDLTASTLSYWIVITGVTLFSLYLLYNIYSIILLKTSKKARLEASKNLPEYVKSLLPITSQEKKTWVYVAFSAGITEEIVYRGYLFFALGFLFPSLSIFHILLISTLLFGLGHVYQGREMVKPTILGLFFGFSYILFDSLFPIIILHVAQDLVVTDLIEKKE